MEKARQFLCIYDKSNDYNERLLSLYNGLYLLLKDEIWSKVQGIGMERERPGRERGGGFLGKKIHPFSFSATF